MVGEGKMRYASGHERIGTMDNDEWTGEAVYLEVTLTDKHCNEFRLTNRKFLEYIYRGIRTGH